MNIEVEIKVKAENTNDIREELLEKGKMVKSIRQIDEYYIPCHRDFFAQKPFPVEWLRIRTNPDRTIFEYDKSVKDEKGEQEYAMEYETDVSHPEELRKILDFLDFKRKITVDKEREVWDCGKLEVCLDNVKDLGEFIEVEAKGEFKDPAEAKKSCKNFLEELGVDLTKTEPIKTGYPVLLAEKNETIKKDRG